MKPTRFTDARAMSMTERIEIRVLSHFCPDQLWWGGQGRGKVVPFTEMVKSGEEQISGRNRQFCSGMFDVRVLMHICVEISGKQLE